MRQDGERGPPPHESQGHAYKQTQQHSGKVIPALHHATKPFKPLRYQPNPPRADEGHLGLKELHCGQTPSPRRHHRREYNMHVFHKSIICFTELIIL